MSSLTGSGEQFSLISAVLSHKSSRGLQFHRISLFGGLHVCLISVSEDLSHQYFGSHVPPGASAHLFLDGFLPIETSSWALPDARPYRNVQWFRGGLVFEAHRILYLSA